MSHFPFLAQRLFNVPLAIHPRKAEIVVAALAERLGVASMRRLTGDALSPGAFWLDDDDDDSGMSGPRGTPDPGYDLVEGVAIIPVIGTLVQKLGGARPYSGMTGYSQIRAAFLIATEDPEVEAIALQIDSPGGECAACFDLVDEIYRARGEKPIWAICDEVAYSAAYAIASAADRIIVPRAGGVGSVGIVACHVDFSEALRAGGLTVTFLQYGARKTDGAPEKPLDDEARTRFQADIDTLGDLFVETVARNRGLTTDAIRATEASTYMGAAGVELGLADAVMAPDAAFRSLLATLGASQ